MKFCFLVSLALLATITVQAQNVGIGTTQPVEKLDVAGAVKIGGTTTAAPAKGTIRWNEVKNDFEGYNGVSWVSLTGGKSAWGSQTTYSQENSATNASLTFINIEKFGTGFGTSVAANANRLVIGAPFNYDENGTTSSQELGSVTYYFWNLHKWVPGGTFMPLTFSGRELVGYSVSLSGDKVAAGAPGADINGKVRQGRVLMLPSYASSRDNFISLVASDGAEQDQFGQSVSLSGNTVLVGAPYKKVGTHTWQGKAYLFQPFLATWMETAQLTAPDGAANDLFGKKVALDGNWAAVAAPEATVGQLPKAGKVYLYQRSNNTWVHRTTLASDGGGYNFFGTALHLANDTLVVGSPDNLFGDNGAGSVKIYVRNGTAWNLQATLTAPDAEKSDAFGTSVSRLGDQLLIGAPGADIGSNERQGKAYIYRLTGGTWMHEATLAASSGSTNNYFGMAATLSPRTAIVGAPSADVGERKKNGQVYFFKHQ